VDRAERLPLAIKVARSRDGHDGGHTTLAVLPGQPGMPVTSFAELFRLAERNLIARVKASAIPSLNKGMID
jgi:hypothetical protein